MIEIGKGSIFDSGAEALVNPVNCVGVSGAGLALEFKKQFPKNFLQYKVRCDCGTLRPGEIVLYLTVKVGNPIYIINVATKMHWREKSTLEIVERGIKGLVRGAKALELKSIAVPALGCGLGGLRWEDVEPLLRLHFDKLPALKVILYPPQR